MTGHQQCKPELKELVHYTNKIVRCWKELALHLSLSSEVMDTEKCYHMFTTWLKQTPDSCWCQEACAFKMLYLNCEAGEIVKLFLDCELMCPDSINL